MPPVHPRPRGEHGTNPSADVFVGGSSPPARGTRIESHTPPVFDRFIPARAGNTQMVACWSCRCAVHPRPRGEHDLSSIGHPIWHGSSPPARGTHRHVQGPHGVQRFIPARAGNTLPLGTRRRWRAVHPRPRGEHPVETASGEQPTGSSPPARGTRKPPDSGGCGSRFIPARAGNTACVARPRDIWSVHPRPRGEHWTTRQAAKAAVGSSPPARGTQIDHLSPGHLDRFIPARAGNTPGFRTGPHRLSVHPRPRGEHP